MVNMNDGHPPKNILRGQFLWRTKRQSPMPFNQPTARLVRLASLVEAILAKEQIDDRGEQQHPQRHRIYGWMHGRIGHHSHIHAHTSKLFPFVVNRNHEPYLPEQLPRWFHEEEEEEDASLVLLRPLLHSLAAHGVGVAARPGRGGRCPTTPH
jgi:hypothetical protein